MNLLQYAEKQLVVKVNHPDFRGGDTVTVHYKIKEGDKERVQNYTGVVIQRRGQGAVETFTVRKMSNGVGVERIFPVNSPYIEQIEVKKKGVVRRARIYYLRNLTGKKARIQEKIQMTETETETPAEA
ncbi:MAG: 50S ribosomal protein L19 [Bacteroidetes bacterium]|nr:50S ribosomal protein L19 [Bacteroidota bacterium]